MCSNVNSSFEPLMKNQIYFYPSTNQYLWTSSYAFKVCDSNFELKKSNFKSRYKGNIYLELSSMHLNSA